VEKKKPKWSRQGSTFMNTSLRVVYPGSGSTFGVGYTVVRGQGSGELQVCEGGLFG
jgi:hypothetical protein